MRTYKLTTRGKIVRTLNHAFLVAFSLIALYPFIYFLALSFNDGRDALKGGIYFWPRKFTLENYGQVFRQPFIGNSFIVSLERTVLVTVLAVFLTGILSYALSIRDLPGRRPLLFYFFFTTLFGGGLIPTFILYRQLGLLNTFWVLIIPSLYAFGNMLIMRTFFAGIPTSLPESARIDGASEFTIFARIIVPLSGPVLATIALFVGVGAWNDWFTGEYFQNKDAMRPAATMLNRILAQASWEATTASGGSSVQQGNFDLETARQTGVTPEAVRNTFVIIIVTPILIVYPFVQRFFVKGVMVGSIKE